MQDYPTDEQIVQMESPAKTPPSIVPAIASAPIGRQGIELRDMTDLWSFAQKAVASGFCPQGIDTPEKALIALQIALEVGLTPMQGLQGTAVINKRPSLYGDVAKGICLASPLCEYIESNPIEGKSKFDDDYGWYCKAKRRDNPDAVLRIFTIKDAKLANLFPGKVPSPWALYTDRMLMWRAQSWAMRDAFADVLRGISIKEDIEAQDIREPRDVTPPTPGGKGSQLAEILSDPKPAVPDEADAKPIDESSTLAKQIVEAQAKHDAKQLAEPEKEVPVPETAPEEEAPAEEPEPMPLDDEGLRNLMVQAKVSKSMSKQLVEDVGMAEGIESAVLSDLNDNARLLLETAIRDRKPKK